MLTLVSDVSLDDKILTQYLLYLPPRRKLFFLTLPFTNLWIHILTSSNGNFITITVTTNG